jgi:hypothetical protein
MPGEMQLRQAARYVVVVGCGIIAGGRAVALVQALAQARRLAPTDPAAAEAARALAAMDAMIVAVSLAIAALVWTLLKPSLASAEHT